MVLKKLMQALKGGNVGNDNEGKPKAHEATPVTYQELTITPAPLSEGGQFKTAGSISQTLDGTTKKTAFIRADNHSSLDAAVEHSINKAKQIIDERGTSLFDNPHC